MDCDPPVESPAETGKETSPAERPFGLWLVFAFAVANAVLTLAYLGQAWLAPDSLPRALAGVYARNHAWFFVGQLLSLGVYGAVALLVYRRHHRSARLIEFAAACSVAGVFAHAPVKGEPASAGSLLAWILLGSWIAAFVYVHRLGKRGELATSRSPTYSVPGAPGATSFVDYAIMFVVGSAAVRCLETWWREWAVPRLSGLAKFGQLVPVLMIVALLLVIAAERRNRAK